METYAFQKRHLQLLCLVLVVPIFLLAAGCSARINQFKDFSKAGVAYSAAMADFTDAAGVAAIDADSLILKTARPALSKSKRSSRFREQNGLMKGRLAVLDKIKDHTLLLKAYFEALGTLAGSDIGAKIAGDTKDIADKLKELTPSIADARIRIGKNNEIAILDSVKEPIALVVRGIQLAKLKRELKANGKTIVEALRWHEAAVETIAQIWRTDRPIIQNYRELDVEQYTEGGRLPANWVAQRRVWLIAGTSAELADSASQAASNLRVAFHALTENHLTLENIPRLLSNIDQIMGLLGLAR